MNLSNFHRQHKDVYEQIDKINDLINRSDVEAHFSEIASCVNALAGKLQIHLTSEDKYLYPRLLEDEKVSDMAKTYMDEMGDILARFTQYKDRFNTKSRIEANRDSLESATKSILNDILVRMNKEENELYKLIEA